MQNAEKFSSNCKVRLRKICLFGIALQNFLYISNDILREIRKTLVRDFELDAKSIDPIIEATLLYTQLCEPKQNVSVIKDDPADDRILECATEAKADYTDYIISQDKHLGKLKMIRGIKRLYPDEFLPLL